MSAAARLFACRAVLFDLDGVLTPTAELHMAAWEALFAAEFARRGVAGYRSSDYFTHLDGRPRSEGVAALLADRGIALPLGAPDDPPQADTVSGLGNRKNAEFTRLLEAEGIAPYPGSLALLDALDAARVRSAVVSSSKNARSVLAAAGLGERFGVVVDGLVADERGLPGKPDPDTFLAGAEALGVEPAETAVIEDAVSGVAAAHAGGFGLVVGVDRGTGAAALLEAGAQLVVGDLAELLPQAEADGAEEGSPR